MISVFGSDIGDREIAAVVECMRSQWLGFGAQVDRFEAAFAARLGLPAFAMVDSGSNALFMAVRLLDLPAGSEVILPSFTWVSCAQAVLLAGHVPVFCDVDLDTMNVRRQDIEPHITSRTGAVMVVHYAGLPVDIDPIIDLGFPVIEDAAHAVDASRDGRACGGIGDIGVYSFDAVKNLTAGEGGGITARDPGRIERARMLRYCGIGKSGFQAASRLATPASRWWEYDIRETFIKMLPTNIAAAIAGVQLTRLDELQSRRRVIWEMYDQAFQPLSDVIVPPASRPGDRHGYFTYAIRTPGRDALARTLFDAGIYTTLRYHPLHMNALFGQTSKRLPNCERLNDEALSLPLHPRLSDDDVDRIVERMRQFYAGNAVGR